MNKHKTARPSGMRKTLSWIVGTDRLIEMGSTASIAGPSVEPNTNHSHRSFLPSFDIPRMAPGPSKPTTSVVAKLKRPPPFFHSRPLRCKNYCEEADGSVGTLSSSEIATWKKKATPPLHNNSSSKLTSLKSLLRLGRFQRTSSMDQEADNSMFSMTPDDSVNMKSMTSSFLLSDRASATPDLTLGSPSFATSLDPDSLSPPPRPKRFSFMSGDSRIMQKSKAKGDHSNSIDPAKWAEISISAAELVSHFGRENVIFASALPESSHEDFVEEGMKSDSGEDECVPLYSPLQNREHETDFSITTSSGSMTSLSKWPLPPQYERFRFSVDQ